MTLPRKIPQEILEYLWLEFDESASDSDALKLSDLAYEGKHVVAGVVTHFWAFPTGRGKRWATVEERDDGYRIGISTRGPGASSTDERRALRT